jgi:LPS sulfotransferase NodH
VTAPKPRDLTGPALLYELTGRDRLRREIDFWQRQALAAGRAVIGRARRPTPVLVFTTSRSGSTWFCELLFGINQCGPLPEHLRPSHFEFALAAAARRDLLDNWLEQVSALIRSGRDGGTKLIWDYFPDLLPARELTDPRRALAPLLDLAPVCLRLRRRDGIAQAVSRYRSARTGVYHHYRPAGRWPSAETGVADTRAAIAFDAAAIAHHEGILRRAEEHLDAFLGRLDAPVHEVIYEDLAADAHTVLRPIVARLRQDLDPAAQRRRLQRAMEGARLVRGDDPQQREWAQRYRAERGA